MGRVSVFGKEGRPPLLRFHRLQEVPNYPDVNDPFLPYSLIIPGVNPER